MNSGAVGWRKRQLQKVYDNSVGERLRETLNARIEENDRAANPNRPVYMTVDQLLKLSFFDVFLAVRSGSWTVEDFGIWGHTIEQHARNSARNVP